MGNINLEISKQNVPRFIHSCILKKLKNLRLEEDDCVKKVWFKTRFQFLSFMHCQFQLFCLSSKIVFKECADNVCIFSIKRDLVSKTTYEYFNLFLSQTDLVISEKSKKTIFNSHAINISRNQRLSSEQNAAELRRIKEQQFKKRFTKFADREFQLLSELKILIFDLKKS